MRNDWRAGGPRRGGRADNLAEVVVAQRVAIVLAWVIAAQRPEVRDGPARVRKGVHFVCGGSDLGFRRAHNLAAPAGMVSGRPVAIAR
jgi:hypothetical protein